MCGTAVRVEFLYRQYNYSEGDGEADDVMFGINKVIASDLMIAYAGGKPLIRIPIPLYFLYITGPGSQPATVRVSGTDVSGSYTFRAFGSRTTTVTEFNITDDDAALETVERYPIRFLPTNVNNVELGPNTNIEITDDDGRFFK